MFARPGLCGMGIGRLGLVAASAYAQSVIVSQAYDPHYANVSLLLHGDGADNGTVFTDSSPSPKTVTAYGNAKTSTAQSKFGGSSIAFDGSGDYLSVPGSSGEFSFGTGDFTIEFWARWSSVASEDAICFGDGIGWTLYIYPAGKLQWGRIWPKSPVNLLESASSVTTGQWYHIAVTRESGVVKFWIDGNASGSVSDTESYSANGTLSIGKSHSNKWANGFFDDFRVTKGVARYTANFTPPTEAFPNLAPPYAQSVIANVSLLLHGDGADNGTVFTDSSPSPKTVTAYGNAKTSTAQSKFGGSSIAFDGSGDYLSVPGSSGEFSFGTGDFTIEFWARWSSVASEDAICFGDGIGWTLYIYPAGKLQWGRIWPKSPVNLLESASSVTTGQWYHIAVTRESGVVKFWIDGNASGSVSDTESYSANGTLSIGKSHSNKWANGFFDDFRVTKGVARYTGNFTPPTEAFPNPVPP